MSSFPKNIYNLNFPMADQLVEKATKQEIAETARLLAVNFSHYQIKFGELPLEDTLAMVNIDKPNAEQTDMLV